ncbi:MAG: hypothetical protein V3V14_05025, partial [Saprospiraceae bacterium]
MKIATHFFPVTKTARYVTFGILSPKTKFFWFAIHGTKMLCEQMLYKFKNFDPSTHFIVAPEALSRFYLEGYSGDVVATWMTSRDRLLEIEDYSNYLSQLYNEYLDQLPNDCKKIIFAFSQGGTTAFRWLHQKNIDVDFLIPYSCWIPEDIDLKLSKTKLDNVKMIYTYGIQDQFFDKN